jgi:hypothetical protein
MPDDERDATVTNRHAPDEELRKAFQSLGDTSREEPSSADLDQVWRAVSEELPAVERRALVDRMATDPALAESWRVAQELYRETPRSTRAATIPVGFRTLSWMPAAAVLLIAIGIGVIVQLSRPTVQDTFRDSERYVVESLVQSDTTLPRNAFLLRWTPGPEGSRYHVRVTTDDLQVLTTVSDLTTPELEVAGDLLSTVAPGSPVFWQVDVMLPEGSTVSSPTFVVNVQ